MKAVVAAFNQEKALVGAFSVVTNLRMELFEALIQIHILIIHIFSHVLSCQKVDWVQEKERRVPEQRRSSLGRLQEQEPVGAGQEGAGREVEAWRPEEAAPATLQRTARQGDR